MHYLILLLKYGPGLVKLASEVYDFVERHQKGSASEKKAREFNRIARARRVRVYGDDLVELREAIHKVKKRKLAKRWRRR